ncbi:MAG: beta-galactosidase [Lentisphaeria bacterium]|nr:beta-galactosidase [Lentisphaeria bacterium]
MKLKPAGSVSSTVTPVAVAGDRPGKIVLNLQIEHDGRIIGDAERLITVGDGGPEKYVRKPVAPRAGKSRVEKSGTQATGRELSMELVTPHEKWATPYCRGTIRALVLTNHMQQREIVELAQRLDMEFDTVELSLPSQYRYFTKIGNLKNAQTLLLRYLQENQYDVMVIGGIPWNRYFNADIHKEIEQQVTAGMGLIYVSPLDLDEVGQSMVPLAGGTPMGTRPPAGKWEKIADHWLVNGFDFRIFPLSSNCHYQPTDDAELLANVEDTYPLIAVKRHGNGRVIGLGYDALTHNVDYDHIFTSGLTPRLMVPHYGGKYAGMSCQPEKELRYRYWEYYFAFLSRCVAWAADKASDIDITTFEWSADGTALSIVLDNAGDETAGSLALTLKNKYAEQIEAIARDVVLKTGRNKIEVPVSARAPHGMNFAELIVRNSNAKALNWGVAALPVAHEKFIVGLRFAKESFAAGENIEGTITLDGAAAGKYKLVLRLFDLHGRLLADREAEEMVAAGKSEQPFSLASTRAVAEAGRVEARLFQAGIQRDLVKEDVAITTPYDPRAFYLSGWISRFGSYYLRQMNMAEMLGIGYSAATIDGWMIPHWRPQGYKLIINYAIRMHMERSDEADVMAQYLKTKDKTVLVRKPSFSDPEFLEKCQQRLRNVARTAVNFGGALNYGIGDENRIGAWADFSPHNLAAYRAWLKQEYQNLEALNREWESTYADWDEITPATEQDARTTGQYPPWLTHRQFTERSLTAFLQTCRKTVKAADPPAELHISGTMGATVEAGTDWIQLAKILDVKGYNEWWILGEVFRCFLEKRNQPYVYHYPHMWKVLFHGATGGIGNWCSPALSLAPDFSWTKDGKERRRFMDKAVETGLPRFLQDATRDNSRIALHYSRLSRLATYISGPSSGDKHLEPWEDNVRAWCNLLEDLGFQYDLLSHEQLAEDALQPEAYKLLILPQSTAIYPVELEKIKAYVAAGGTVAANGGTAEFNHHGARLARGALDEVFGVEKGDQGGERVSLKDYRLDVQLLDKDLKTRPGAELVASDKPAMIRNQVGKGKAVYLNFNLNNYNSFIKKRSHNLRIRGYRDLLAGIFAEAGIKAGFSIRSVDNAPLRTEIVAYRSGEATVLAVFYWRQEDSANVAADIVFDGRYHVYDIEKSEYLGHRNEVRTTFEAQGPIHLPTDFRCYALLPVKPGNLDLRVDAEIKPGSELNFSAALPADIKGGTSIAIDVVDPTGMSRRHYRRSLQINYDGDAGRGKIQLALNDPPGRWKIVARDILSGSAAQATFDITR